MVHSSATHELVRYQKIHVRKYVPTNSCPVVGTVGLTSSQRPFNNDNNLTNLPMLLHISKLSITSGTFLSSLKTVIVIPVYKSSDATVVNHYTKRFQYRILSLSYLRLVLRTDNLKPLQ